MRVIFLSDHYRRRRAARPVGMIHDGPDAGRPPLRSGEYGSLAGAAMAPAHRRTTPCAASDVGRGRRRRRGSGPYVRPDEAVDAAVGRRADIGVAVDRLLVELLVAGNRRPLATDHGPPLAAAPIGLGALAVGYVAAGEAGTRLFQALEPGAPVLSIGGKDEHDQRNRHQAREELPSIHGSPLRERINSSHDYCAPQYAVCLV